MNNNKLLNAALEYEQKGWRVLPLRKEGVLPINYGGYRLATTCEITIRNWWKEEPEANVGVLAAKESFSVVQLSREQGGFEYCESIINPDFKMYETLVQDQWPDKVQFFFKHHPDVGKFTKYKEQGIELIGNGEGYVVMDPSVITDVEQDCKLGDINKTLLDFPEQLLPEKLDSYFKNKEQSRTLSPRAKHITMDSVEELAEDAMYDFYDGLKGVGGRDRLLWAATILTHGFELSNESAYKILANEFVPRCYPRINLSTSYGRGLLKRSIRKSHENCLSRPRGWLLQEACSS